MDPLTILAGLKTGLAAGKTVASLSKEIGNFFELAHLRTPVLFAYYTLK